MSLPHPKNGSLPLFRFKGILVSLHWSWLFVAVWQVERQRRDGMAAGWAAAEYLTLFGIVLLHEFGHAFATRQVGGKAENILLWPFGGIAFVNAPHRPGAHLWSIAAGPLVNVALVPVFWLISRYLLPEDISPPVRDFAVSIQFINLFLLAFNVLPIYPMDGGQMLQALLWFKLGFGKALQIASAIGLAGGLGLLGLGWYFERGLLSFLMVGFLMLNCWKSFQASKIIIARERGLPPPVGEIPP
jgi:Zn-dependent protease